MTYEAWRCTYQSGEQAARVAYALAKELQRQNAALKLEAANAKELVSAVGAGGVERLRKGQCQGCAVQQGTHVPMGVVTQISEPMPVGQRALMLSVTASEPFKSQLKECAARIAELEAQLAAAQQGVPVAWRYQTQTGWHATTDADAAIRVNAHHPIEPLYTHPTTQGLEIERLRNLLCKMVDQLERRGKHRDGNAPGHGHGIPGVWDRDNGELAGKRCAWCEVWQEALEVHAAAQAKQGEQANG